MHKMTLVKTIMIFPAIIGLALATSQPNQAAGMAKPINCSSAKQDVATLQKERVSVLREMGAGAQTFIPIGAVIGILGGTYDKNAHISGGQYNKDIDTKISQIRQTYGV